MSLIALISKTLPEIQTRYYRLFSEVMAEVCLKFGTAEYTKAVAEFSEEQPNFTKLLTEVTNSTQDNYTFFIHVVKTCTNMLDQYMGGMHIGNSGSNLSLDLMSPRCSRLLVSFGNKSD